MLVRMIGINMIRQLKPEEWVSDDEHVATTCAKMLGSGIQVEADDNGER